MSSQKFVAAGVQGVLSGPKGTGWHKTTKEIDFTDATQVTCPMTGRQVWAVKSGEFTFHAAPESIQIRRDDLPQMSVLDYDIPVTVEITNPSGVLRSRAVRTTYSGWVVPTNAIPWDVINDLRENGCRVTLYKFDQSESASLIAQVEFALRDQIRETAESAEASAESAAEQFAERQETGTVAQDKAKKYFEQRIKTASKNAKDRLDSYQKAAAIFGFDARALGLQAAAGVAQAISSGIMLRAQRYVEAVRALTAANTATTAALATAAETSQVPPEVMADALRESGNDAAADELQEAFVTPDADTFSLDGAGE